MPKKSLTSYQLWMAEERPKLKASVVTAAVTLTLTLTPHP